jgi:hypothetical protein
MPRRVAEAFASWSLLAAASKNVRLVVTERTEIRVFLSWLVNEYEGNISDLEYLERTKILTDDDVIDWETWVSE